MADRVVYLHGLAGSPAVSPALRSLGVEVVVPQLPGFDGAPGFEAPPDHLGWITALWDALDRTGALPCPVIGASVGGMMAAELAALRPEAVTRLALLGPLGLWDPEHPGVDPFAQPASARMPLLFAGEVPQAFVDAFADRGEAEQHVAKVLVQVAAASMIWPLPDKGLRRRLHRITQPALLVWGEDDRIAPVQLAPQWGLGQAVTVPGAGHMVEWDAPDAVGSALEAFLAG